MPRSLPRRTFLRGMVAGAAASVALPPLEAMLSGNGHVYADGTPIPPKLIYWFWGNGKQGPHFDPASTGTGWSATSELQPLFDAGVADYLSVVSGTEVKLDGTDWSAHNTGRVGIRCAAIVQRGDYPYEDGPTIMERIATELEGSTRERLVRFGVSENQTWNSRRTPLVYGEMDPQALYDRLFGGEELATRADEVRQQSIVDAVRADAEALSRKVGAKDQQRIDKHLETLRSIERRLEASGAACTPPSRPDPREAYDEFAEPLEERNEVYSDILATALACDITRVGDVQFSKAQNNTVFWMFDTRDGQHDITHENTPESASLHHRQVVFTMERLAYLAGRLRETDIGDGNLLDHTVLFATSEQDSGDTGNSHSNNDMPALFIGRAGGLRGGVHHRSGGDTVARLHMTIARAMDLDIGGFGQGENHATEGFGELFE